MDPVSTQFDLKMMLFGASTQLLGICSAPIAQEFREYIVRLYKRIDQASTEEEYTGIRQEIAQLLDEIRETFTLEKHLASMAAYASEE